MQKLIEQHALFVLDLGSRSKVLQTATTAHTEMRTARRDTHETWLQDPIGDAFVELAAPAKIAKHDPFTR